MHLSLFSIIDTFQLFISLFEGHKHAAGYFGIVVCTILNMEQKKQRSELTDKLRL